MTPAQSPHLDAATLARHLAWPALIDAMSHMHRQDCQVPERLHYEVGRAGASAQDKATLLVMPAWSSRHIGLKVVNVFPANARAGHPALNSTYQLFSNETGTLIATLEGMALTVRRTVATSAAAAARLARDDARHLLVLGAGRVARLIPHAYARVRPLARVEVWDIDAGLAQTLVNELRMQGFEARIAPDLDAAIGRADMVSAATLSTRPLVHAHCVKPGTHVDLIGAFRPTMRESDDALMAHATIVVDTPMACHEAGDLCQPLQSGLLRRQAISTLADVVDGRHPGRRHAQEVTVFKSVGSARADLVAAALAVQAREASARP